jgi:hypothetical protein
MQRGRARNPIGVSYLRGGIIISIIKTRLDQTTLDRGLVGVHDAHLRMMMMTVISCSLNDNRKRY